MDPKELYKQKLLTIPEAVALVQSHQTIGVAMAASEPPGLLAELGNHRDRLEDVTCVGLPAAAPVRFYAQAGDGAGISSLRTGSTARPTARCTRKARTSYIPNNLHQAATASFAAASNKVNVFWGTATPPEAAAICRFRLGLVMEKQLIEAADLVILEINENLPWTLGDTQIHISEVDYVVENHVPLPSSSRRHLPPRLNRPLAGTSLI